MEPREDSLSGIFTCAKYAGETPVTFTCMKHTGFPGSSATTLRCNLGVYPLARRTGTQTHRSLPFLQAHGCSQYSARTLSNRHRYMQVIRETVNAPGCVTSVFHPPPPATPPPSPGPPSPHFFLPCWSRCFPFPTLPSCPALACFFHCLLPGALLLACFLFYPARFLSPFLLSRPAPPGPAPPPLLLMLRSRACFFSVFALWLSCCLVEAPSFCCFVAPAASDLLSAILFFVLVFAA